VLKFRQQAKSSKFCLRNGSNTAAWRSRPLLLPCLVCLHAKGEVCHGQKPMLGSVLLAWVDPLAPAHSIVHVTSECRWPTQAARF
jgi:hypothetical protein